MTLLSAGMNVPTISEFFDDNWMKSRFSTNSLPLVNVINTPESYLVELAVPGFSKENFKVNMDNGILTVTGNSTFHNDVNEFPFTRQEFTCSSFTRSFRLPENINTEDIIAKFENGVLRLTIAKTVSETSNMKEVAIH